MDNICDKYICYLDQKFKEALYIGKNTYPVPHCAPVFLLFLRIQTNRISRVRSNTPPATHRMMMTVSIFTSSRTIMLVPFFAAVSDTSETNASSIIKDKPSVPMNPSYTMLESLRDMVPNSFMLSPSNVISWERVSWIRPYARTKPYNSSVYDKNYSSSHITGMLDPPRTETR